MKLFAPALFELGVAVATACIVALSAPGSAADVLELITAAEASLPSVPVPILELRGSPIRRPQVEILSPPPAAGVMHSPIALTVNFSAFGGAKINANSVLVTYLKQPNIDLTQRLKPFISAAGIDLAQAEVPPGLHQLWIELKDDHGHVGGAELTFQIVK